jgi:hypothetical protein
MLNALNDRCEEEKLNVFDLTELCIAAFPATCACNALAEANL